MKDDVYIDVDPIQEEDTLSWILSDSSQSRTLLLSIILLRSTQYSEYVFSRETVKNRGVYFAEGGARSSRIS